MKALDLAGYVVNYCLFKGQPATNLRLQKILYFLQIQSLIDSKLNSKLIDSDFEAWKFGPVIRDVYYAYCLNAGMPILNVAKGTNVIEKVPEYVNKCIDKALTMQPWELVEKSHRKGGAWERCYVEKANNIIPIDLIKLEASQLAEALS